MSRGKSLLINGVQPNVQRTIHKREQSFRLSLPTYQGSCIPVGSFYLGMHFRGLATSIG